MKPAQVLLLNLVVVVVALVIYDQVRGGAPGASQERSSAARSRGLDDAAVEERLASLEAGRRESVALADPHLLDRLDALEAAVQGAAASDGLPAGEQTLLSEEVMESDLPSSQATAELPSPMEIRRFRDLQEAVRREDSIKRNKARVDGTLSKLPFRLTKRQRTKIHYAFAAFEPRVDEIWTEVKAQAQATIAAGGEVSRAEIVPKTMAVIQQEFAQTLAGIVDRPADADAIATALMPGRK